jgi:hypothetical protein
MPSSNKSINANVLIDALPKERQRRINKRARELMKEGSNRVIPPPRIILHPAVTKWAIKQAVAKLEQQKIAQHTRLEELNARSAVVLSKRIIAAQKAAISASYNKMIKDEREYYSTVRIEQGFDKKWYLCYGDEIGEEGNVGSDTPDECIEWFLDGGR